ncbi:MAG TPA: sigma-70 family RNA polymerase sigma factor [Candidatus Dormibacteraeota bacterium]|nr:sigma-70 family RNA polymerase sigma factor [Candidatus Dormibacteraeota bacterium]
MQASVDPGFLESVPGSEPGSHPALMEEAPSALRVWLLRGRIKFGVHPRRRFGKHPRARGLLSSDLHNHPTPTGIWTDMVSALQRHTAFSGLTRLDDADRRLLTLAYLEGHSNREIAAMLDISVRTVGRRLTKALERFEKGVLWTGTWISALVLVFLAYVSQRAGLAWRTVDTTLRGPGQHAALVLAAAGAAGALVVGLVVTTHGPVIPARPSTPAAVRMVPLALHAPTGAPTGAHSIIDGNAGVAVTLISVTSAAAASSSGASAGPAGCGGNPTDAPPSLPVASRGAHPTGAPVTHPAAGGCGH